MKKKCMKKRYLDTKSAANVFPSRRDFPGYFLGYRLKPTFFNARL